eukprot:scaffold34126_cov87-Phaeocystis_antarctica.AAC.2
MDLDTPLVAAHWHTHERRVREKVRSSRGGTVHQVSGPSHDEQRLAAREEDGQAGERLLDVALVDARLVLRHKARRAYILTERASVRSAGKGCSETVGGEHQLTSQRVGSLPVISWRHFAQRATTACLAPGASSSSRH